MGLVGIFSLTPNIGELIDKLIDCWGIVVCIASLCSFCLITHNFTVLWEVQPYTHYNNLYLLQALGVSWQNISQTPWAMASISLTDVTLALRSLSGNWPKICMNLYTWTVARESFRGTGQRDSQNCLTGGYLEVLVAAAFCMSVLWLIIHTLKFHLDVLNR